MRKFYTKISKLLLLAVFLIGFGQLGFGQSKGTIFSENCSTQPGTWTFNSVSQESGYWLEDNNSDYVYTPVFGSYTSLSLVSNLRSYGSGSAPECTIEISTDGGTSWTGGSSVVSSIPNSYTNYTWNIGTLSGSNNRIRWRRTSGTRGVRINNITLTGTAVAGPEMNVQGNSHDIADGDNTPSTTDHTDFGDVCTTGGHVDRIFTIQNTGVATLNFTHSPIVVVTGTGFSVLTQPGASSIASGGADLTFTVRFDPSSDGVSNGTISINNNDVDENPYNFSIRGTGGGFPPTITNPTSSDIQQTTADLGGDITDIACDNVTERGIYWSTTSGFADGTGTKVSTFGSYSTGAFVMNDVSGFSQNTTYYFKAFATNAGGTVYTSEASFKTLMDCSAAQSIPYTQDFESWSLGASDQECWTNDTDDDCDWTSDEGGTPSTATGPSVDHTTGTTTGNYLYIESSNPNNPSKVARINTPTFDFTNSKLPQLEFWYHMYGATMGTLQIDLFYNGTWHNAIAVSWNGGAATRTPHTGNTDSWYKATADISDAIGYDDVQIRFSGTTGTSYTSDMAIDDVQIFEKPVENVTNFTVDCPAKTSMDITWTKPVGTYGTDWDGVVVFARASSAVDADMATDDAANFTANSVYGSGTQDGNSYCIAKTTTNTDGNITVTGLTPGVTYHFKAFAYRELTGISNDVFATGITTSASSVSSIANVTQAVAYGGNAQATVRWQNISCYDEVLVVGHANTSVSATPSGDGSAYTPNSVFGSGTDMGSSNYVVYKNVGTGVTVTSLTNGTTYYFKIFVRKGTDWSSGVEVTVTPSDQTWFKPGELLIVGYDASFGSNDKIYLATLVDIKPGTEWYYVNSRFEAGAAANQRTMRWYSGGDNINSELPGVVKFTNATSQINAGSIIVFEIGNSSSPTNIKVANNSAPTTHSGLSGTLLTGSYGANISGGGDDQIYLLQGEFKRVGTNHYYKLNGRVLFGLTNGESWKDLSQPCYGGTNGDYRASRLHPDLECFNIEYTSRYVQAWYKNSSPHGTSKNQILSGLMNPGNWTTNSNYSPDIPEDFIAAYTAGDVGKPFDASGSGADGTWTGNDADNDNWFKCGNWEGLVVPDNSMDVIIPDVTNDCSIDYNASEAVKYGRIAECNNLSIENGGNLILDGSDLDKLYVMGDITIKSGGNLDMDGTGSEDGHLYLYGDYDNQGNSGQLDQGYGTIHFVGNTEQHINCTSSQEYFYNIDVNNTNGTYNSVSLGTAGAYVSGKFTHTNGNFNISPTRKLTINGPYHKTNGTFRGRSSTSELTISGSGEIDELVFSGNQMLKNFIITRTSHDVTISPNIYVYSNLNISSGAVLKSNNAIFLYGGCDVLNNGRKEGNGYIISKGWTDANVLSGNGYYGNLKINKSTIPQNTEMGGSFTVNNFIFGAANYFDTKTYDLTVEGNFKNNYGPSYFIPNSQTVSFHGTSPQTITADNGQKFYNMDIYSGSEVTTDASLLTISHQLEIDEGTLIIPPLKNVTAEDILTYVAPYEDRLILKSDATGSGSLIQKSGNVPATVERYITGNAWHYMYPTLSAIPTTTYTTEGSDVNENLYSYNEANKDYWNATTIYETTGWTSEVASSNLRTDKAYIYNRYGMATRTVSQTGGKLTSSDRKFNITYNTHTGTIGNGCETGWNNYDGWNLIGNPYASAIDWDETLSLQTGTATVEKGVYCYDDSQDKYQYYVSGGGNSPYNSIGITVNSGSNYIPAGQGFMVKARSSVGTSGSYFVMKKGARVHNTQAFWKGEDTIPNLVRLNIEKDGYTDETVIRTLPQESGVTEDHDGDYDAYKLFAWNNTKPQLYSRTETNSRYFAVNSLPEFVGHKIVPLGVYVGETGEYSINMTENNFENTHIWLEDRTLGDTTNLITTPNYTFNQEVETTDDRFFLHFEKNNAPVLEVNIPDQETQINEVYEYYLPENLFSDEDFEDKVTISVSKEDGSELPTWISYNAEENKIYGTPTNLEVLKIKVTGTDIFGASNSDIYTLTVKGLNSIISLSENAISMYPNPTSAMFTLQITNLDEKANITISTVTGQILTKLSTRNEKSIIDLSKFAKGLYFVDIQIKEQVIRKIIILK